MQKKRFVCRFAIRSQNWVVRNPFFPFFYYTKEMIRYMNPGRYSQTNLSYTHQNIIIDSLCMMRILRIPLSFKFSAYIYRARLVCRVLLIPGFLLQNHLPFLVMKRILYCWNRFCVHCFAIITILPFAQYLALFIFHAFALCLFLHRMHWVYLVMCILNDLSKSVLGDFLS